MQIEHNPDEKRPANTVWWVIWPIIALLWVAQIYLHGWSSIDWFQIALGGLTMGVLATWAIEITGNKVPASWNRWLGRDPGIRKQ